MINGGAAFLTYLPFEGVIAPADRALNRVVDRSLFMATVTPGAACTAIWHR